MTSLRRAVRARRGAVDVVLSCVSLVLLCATAVLCADEFIFTADVADANAGYYNAYMLQDRVAVAYVADKMLDNTTYVNTNANIQVLLRTSDGGGGAAFSPVQTLFPYASETHASRFGFSLALCDDILVAGAPYSLTNEGTGLVYLWFEDANGHFGNRQQIFPAVGEATLFGAGIACSRRWMLVTACSVDGAASLLYAYLKDENGAVFERILVYDGSSVTTTETTGSTTVSTSQAPTNASHTDMFPSRERVAEVAYSGNGACEVYADINPSIADTIVLYVAAIDQMYVYELVQTSTGGYAWELTTSMAVVGDGGGGDGGGGAASTSIAIYGNVIAVHVDAELYIFERDAGNTWIVRDVFDLDDALGSDEDGGTADDDTGGALASGEAVIATIPTAVLSAGSSVDMSDNEVLVVHAGYAIEYRRGKSTAQEWELVGVVNGVAPAGADATQGVSMYEDSAVLFGTYGFELGSVDDRSDLDLVKIGIFSSILIMAFIMCALRRFHCGVCNCTSETGRIE